LIRGRGIGFLEGLRPSKTPLVFPLSKEGRSFEEAKPLQVFFITIMATPRVFG